MTEKLYYTDPYQTEFTAEVLECSEHKKGYGIRLSATAFFPEGGGQPYDTGLLQDVRVLEVHEKDGEVLHYTDRPLEVGSRVTGKIDWERRFDLTQQHSGEHIVSGLIHAAFGYDNVGFHLGSDTVTIDFNGEITEDGMREIEDRANALIWKNVETHIFYPTPEELKTLAYRSKKKLTGAIRIVEFPGGDMCACCGTHVARTGEIGMVKLLSVEKFRDGTRMEMISGRRVLHYLNMVQGQNQKISVLLSARPDRTADAVKHLSEENFRLKGRVLSAEDRLFAQEARALAGTGNVLLFEKNLDSDSVRKLAVAVMETCCGRCAVFSDNGDGTFKYAIGEKDGDLRDLVKIMNRTLNGRGGGKPFFAQGSVTAAEEEIRGFFKEQVPSFSVR